MIWNEIYEILKKSPSQLKLIKKMIESGVSIRDGKIYINNIQIDEAKLSRSAGVDRRVVRATLSSIEDNIMLKKFFMNLKAIPDLSDSAREMGWGAMEVIVSDPSKPGILAEITSIISAEGIIIRQAFVDDPELVEEPKLHVVTQSKIPGEIIQKLMELNNIKKIVIK